MRYGDGLLFGTSPGDRVCRNLIDGETVATLPS
jgi:hypothetical protein